jgi:secondary thiamine-phosphate synthase enzyme
MSSRDSRWTQSGSSTHTHRMKTHQDDIQVETRGHRHAHDITDEVSQIVHQSGIETGTVHVFNVGSTACIGTIEFEPGLEGDISEMLDKLIPPSTHYGHEQAWHDGNGHSHLQATLMGPSLTVPISGGHLVLGTWQQIFHLECDVKPRSRRIIVTATGS